VQKGRHAFAYVFEGEGSFGEALGAKEASDRTLLVFGDGDELMVHAGSDGVRFLLVSGVPLDEPVAWRGPIVMNTDEELRRAFQELEDGTFLKEG
jgi:redox-sensitive bicupin YhaK (pirin superfamily)